MRVSNYLLATVKETPADAEIVSHRLMLRAGLLRKLAAGLYTWLPLGLRVLRKVEHIVREEMDRAGAQEVLMPAIQPAELWQESGRWEEYGPELLRLTDRHNRDFCFGPTHEEIITDLIRREIRSYRQLPLNLYQIPVGAPLLFGNLDLIASFSFSIPEVALTVSTLPAAGTVPDPTTHDLVVEIFTPNGQTEVHKFFIGSPNDRTRAARRYRAGSGVASC